MLVLVFTTCNPRREKMQEKEKDALKDALLGKKIVEYYRKDSIDPAICTFQGSLDQFLQLSEIKPYGKKLKCSSCENPHEASVVVERRDNGDRVILIAEEIEIG